MSDPRNEPLRSPIAPPVPATPRDAPLATPAAPAGSPAARPARLRRAGSVARRALPFTAGIVAALIAIELYSILAPRVPPLTKRDVQQGIRDVLASQTPGPALSQLAYEVIRPSLVLIETTGPGASSRPGASRAPGASAAPGPGDTPTEGLGSGVVVDAAGDVLTALHVVGDATTIRLTFADGSDATAEVTTRQPENDIAVLRPSRVPAGLPPATLGNPNAMRIGSDAYVVGNPFGLTGSLSSGVVSGLDRSFRIPGSDHVIHGLIQVDAAVNPGNSGGPLVDRGGAVVGIVTALINPTSEDVFIGIGLAVPIDVAGGAVGLPPY